MQWCIFDEIRNASMGASIVLVERHCSYLTGPLLARCPDNAVATARNYSATEHPSTFLLDRDGIELAWQQGRKMKNAQRPIIEIVGSEQGRGPDTGLRISEGFHEATGRWIPFWIDPKANYPVYDYETLLAYFRANEEWDPMSGQWLNGEHPDLVVSDTPQGFKERFVGVIENMLVLPGIRIITSHFENLVLTHSLFVEQVDLGNIPEDWFPEKGGGVLIIREPDGSQKAFDYHPSLELHIQP